MGNSIRYFAVLTLVLFPALIFGVIPTSERDALIALYNNTDGANWTNHSNWLGAPGTEDTWYGITIESDHVTDIMLFNNKLSGPLPSELGNLPYLEKLYLSYNSITGTIPTQLGSLSQLRTLNLAGNQLSGAIPSQLRNLSNLTFLGLGQNQLTGNIPPELEELDNLVFLELYSNDLDGSIPPEIGSFNRLQTIYLYGNNLTGGIPSQLQNLSNLQELQLSSNNLTGSIPSELGNIITLTRLSLNNNNLGGSIPSSLGNLANLQRLTLDYNNLGGIIPSQLGNLSQLQYFTMDYNHVWGTIPSQLGDLTNLKTLSLHSNQLSGTIPSSLGDLLNLEVLHLSGNQLYGTIPSELCNLTNLTDLKLNYNQLTGSIPSNIGNLTKLRFLFLRFNQLSGNLPLGLGDLVNLLELRLNKNKLSGEIPNVLMNLTKITLTNLSIGYNCLYTDDPDLRAWLTSVDPFWENNQDECSDLPTIATLDISSITSVSAVSGGNITAEGNGAVTARGVCWSTLQTPTTSDSKTTDGSGIGLFTSTITGLTANTTYYVRAYAVNYQGTAYGSEKSFTTSTVATIPTVTTTDITSITPNSAVSGGNVTSDGGDAVTSRGVCWSMSQNPTTSDNKTTDGSGAGSFTSAITGLTANTTYYVRAYAVNSQGTGYGSEKSFTTGSTATVPTVITTDITSITLNSAVSGGNVISDGGDAVTLRGVCWSMLQNPTTSDSKTTDGSGTGSFSSTITGLTNNTTYYVRAYAINNQGTGYGSERSFTTSATATIPTVTTSVPTSVASKSAVSGGNVTSDGGDAVTSRGVCWSMSQNPTTSDSKTTDGSGTGSFSSTITGLTNNTTYYIRAYAVNNQGTAYGANKSFTTTTTDTFYQLSVTSWPTSGAEIDVSPVDNNENGNGITPFSRTYISGTSVTLTAPDTFGNYEFNRWQVDGQNKSGNSTDIVMNGNREAEAIYEEAAPPEIFINRDRLNFAASSSGVVTTVQTCFIENSGGGTLNWNVTNSADWLTCSPGSGSGAQSISISVDPSGLSVSTYETTVSFTAENANNSPVELPVFFKIYPPGETVGPFGEFATPADGSTVRSSIPVTGWALDDIGIRDVKIYLKSGSTQVHIGDAVFVEGARPDLEETFQGYPINYKGGWGYMLLTNFLPNQGNGNFTLLAVATDLEGKQTTLGTKEISCDNANAVKPFGAIDQPLQGGTISDSHFFNWGWVLTPLPNSIPTDGSTIQVFVDGVKLGSPVYNIYRSDIASLFPGYANSDGAAGYFTLDTTVFPNGVHSIYWLAEDSAGHKDGIGSRFFTVQNTGTSISGTMNKKNNQEMTPHFKSPSTFQKLLNRVAMTKSQPVWIKRGFERDSHLQVVFPGEDGVIKIYSKELQRLEIHFKEKPRISKSLSDMKRKNLKQIFTYGYSLERGKLRSLPPGSTILNQENIFIWQPGPGFSSDYRLVFFHISTESIPVQHTRINISMVIDD